MSLKIYKYKFIQVLVISAVLLLGTSKIAYSDIITVKSLGGGDYTTISDAIANAFTGDIIEVYTGRYEEAVVIDKDLTLKGMGPQTVVIDSLGIGISVDDYRNAVISGFYITAAISGIRLNGHQNTVIENNCIVSCINNGIEIRGAYSNATIENNTIAYNGGDGIHQSDSHYHESYLTNNIIYRNSVCGIERVSGSSILSYNDVYQNSTDYCGVTAHVTDISLNPLFLNPPIDSCILQSSSPCMNAGSPGTGDFDPDRSRNDMGTYGGPNCAAFWPYPPGAPIITDITATPTSVPKGSNITIEATGEVYE